MQSECSDWLPMALSFHRDCSYIKCPYKERSLYAELCLVKTQTTHARPRPPERLLHSCSCQTTVQDSATSLFHSVHSVDYKGCGQTRYLRSLRNLSRVHAQVFLLSQQLGRQCYLSMFKAYVGPLDLAAHSFA